MQEGNARLKLNKFHSDVPVTGVTPAELMILHVVHQHNVGSNPIEPKEMTDVKEIQVQSGVDAQQKPVFRSRSGVEEMARLRSKYGHLVTKKGDRILTMLFPGAAPALPEKFTDVKLENLTFDGTAVGAVDMGTSGGAAINQK